MKKFLTSFGALAVVVSMGSLAAAWPGNGGGIACSNCHGSPRTDGFNLTGADGLVNGKDAFLIEPGQTKDIGISVTNGNKKYGLGLFNLPGTGLTPDADWFAQSGISYTATPAFQTTKWIAPGPDPWTFTVGAPSGQAEGDYLLQLELAGKNGGMYSQVRDFYVSVVPEPTSALLLCVGFVGLLLYGRRRRKAAA